jgi:hypothetical protein
VSGILVVEDDGWIGVVEGLEDEELVGEGVGVSDDGLAR